MNVISTFLRQLEIRCFVMALCPRKQQDRLGGHWRNNT